MRDPHGLLHPVLVDDDRDFNLTGGNHLDIDALFREGGKELGRHPAVAAHPDPDHREFGDPIGQSDFTGQGLFLEIGDNGLEPMHVIPADGKGDIRFIPFPLLTGTGYVLHDHIHVDPSFRYGLKEARRHSRLIRHPGNVHFSLVFFQAHSANNNIFHLI